jgi:hypothetical protein
MINLDMLKKEIMVCELLNRLEAKFCQYKTYTRKVGTNLWFVDLRCFETLCNVQINHMNKIDFIFVANEDYGVNGCRITEDYNNFEEIVSNEYVGRCEIYHNIYEKRSKEIEKRRDRMKELKEVHSNFKEVIHEYDNSVYLRLSYEKAHELFGILEREGFSV